MAEQRKTQVSNDSTITHRCRPTALDPQQGRPDRLRPVLTASCKTNQTQSTSSQHRPRIIAALYTVNTHSGPWPWRPWTQPATQGPARGPPGPSQIITPRTTLKILALGKIDVLPWYEVPLFFVVETCGFFCLKAGVEYWSISAISDPGAYQKGAKKNGFPPQKVSF